MEDRATEADVILLDEYSMADAIRVLGVTLPTMKTWMANGTLRQDDWKIAPGARGPGRDGYLIQRGAIARAGAERGRVCNWAAARSAQATPQVAALIAQLRSQVEDQAREIAKLNKRLSEQWRYGADVAVAREQAREQAIGADVLQAHPVDALSVARTAPAPALGAYPLPTRQPVATMPRAALVSAHANGQRPASRWPAARTNNLPAGLVTGSAFAYAHGFQKHQMNMWREETKAGGALALVVERGEWIVNNAPTKVALAEKGRQAVVRRHSHHPFWKRCGKAGCECEDATLYSSPELYLRAGINLRPAPDPAPIGG